MTKSQVKTGLFRQSAERIISVPYGNQPTSPINRNFLLLTKKKPRPAIDEALSEYMGFEVGRFRVYGYIIYPVL